MWLEVRGQRTQESRSIKHDEVCSVVTRGVRGLQYTSVWSRLVEITICFGVLCHVVTTQSLYSFE